MMNKILRYLNLGAIVGPLPVTLVNGTIADANDVMSDLQWIANQVNANASAGAGTIARNILYNGSMQLAQRIGTGTVTVTGTKAYGLDRWQVASGAAGSASASRVATVALHQFNYAHRMQRTAGNTATTLIQVAQSLESYDSIQMQGQTVTLSFYARAGANYSANLNALVATVYTGTGSDENVLTGYTGSAASVTQTFNITNSWARYTVTGAIPATATEVGLVFAMTPTGTAGASDSFDITGTQLEISPSASSFDFRPFQEMVARCQRYYQKSFILDFAPVFNTASNSSPFYFPAVAAGTKNFRQAFTLQTPMRSTALGVIYDPFASDNQVYDQTQAAPCAGCSIYANANTASLIGKYPVSALAADELCANWSIDGEL